MPKKTTKIKIKKKQPVNDTPAQTKRPWLIWRALKFIWRKKWWILLIGAALIVVKILFNGNTEKQSDYVTLNISHGDLRQVVSATGEIQPVNTVNVGSQVSGTIDNLYVDFNTKLQKANTKETKHYMMKALFHAQKWNNHKHNMNKQNNL